MHVNGVRIYHLTYEMYQMPIANSNHIQHHTYINYLKTMSIHVEAVVGVSVGVGVVAVLITRRPPNNRHPLAALLYE